MQTRHHKGNNSITIMLSVKKNGFYKVEGGWGDNRIYVDNNNDSSNSNNNNNKKQY